VSDSDLSAALDGLRRAQRLAKQDQTGDPLAFEPYHPAASAGEIVGIARNAEPGAIVHEAERSDEARSMLTEIYNWFTEGLDSADLREVKALLDELTSRSSGGLMRCSAAAVTR
jgi:hypothetical protein